MCDLRRTGRNPSEWPVLIRSLLAGSHRPMTLVLESGAFSIQRALLEKVLRSFDKKEIIILEADDRRLRIGRFSCSVTRFDPKPEPPTQFESFTGALRLQGEGPKARL